MAVLRAAAVGVGLALLLALPGLLLLLGGLAPSALAGAAWSGWRDARDSVGWVLIPQLVLAVGVVGLLLQRLVCGAAGWVQSPTPRWLAPAVESALLLGMLGTISGMVRGFAGSSPEALEPAPLLHALGTALRSSFLGFGIALIGVWIRSEPTSGPSEVAP